MRKTVFGLVLLGTAAALAADVTPGVSIELARERKECLDSVKYDIAFHYAPDDEAPFRFEEEILFHYNGKLKDWLQIDFDGEELGVCTVNDIPCTPGWRENHIVIPKDLLRQGQNKITLEGSSSDKALNSNPGYMYTLFVPANAHSAFPCFDQPDLKASFTTTLHIPRDYECLSSMDIASVDNDNLNGTKRVAFKVSPQLPTYLMSWVAGDFKKETTGGMTVLHNETDSLKTAQIPEMCDIASQAIRWLEDYAGVPYPFEKYDFAIIPGFQFGGMEHPGAILYPPETTFLSENPTPEELLWRYELIAHETSHMWFGDLVTMRWFDDVWTKEVFANFMASKISSASFPDIDHNFNFIRANYPNAYYTDRTDGTHPIAQTLDNLNNAGLVYGNIIYNKAPIMMRMLEKRLGEEKLREGLRAYLDKYAFGNSSWDELIELLDSVAPEADVKGFSEAWVKKKGIPTITTEYDDGRQTLTVTQHDPAGEGTVWPQNFTVTLVGTKGSKDIHINLYEKEYSTQADATDLGTLIAVIPNSHGDGYGYFKIENADAYLDNWRYLGNDGRYGAILNLTNAWVAKDLEPAALEESLLKLLPEADHPIIAAAVADLLATMATQNEIGEDVLWIALESTRHPSVKQRLLRSIYSQCVDEPSAERLYRIWDEESEPLMNERDYMSMAYRLAVLKPGKASDILATQWQRIADNQNLAREFDFISRACTEDTDSLFETLKVPENRRPEPWTSKLLSLIFDPSRPQPSERIKEALDMLPEIQATGGIFFPTKWIKAVTGGMHAPENRDFIEDYCKGADPENPLTRKLLESSYLVRKFRKR